MAHLKDLIVNGPVRATSKVYSPEFVGDLTGTATKATQDADGNVIDETYLPLKGGEMSGNLEFSNSGTTTRGVIGTVGGNDYWRIVGGATADNGAYLEIATADDGNEPIYVRQYSNGKFGTLARTATLLDGSGNTKFPGKVTASSFAGALTGNVTGNVSGSSGSCTGNSATATKLKTARNIKVNLGSTSAASFDGSGDATVGVTGTLGAGNGGTGKTSLQDSANALINSLNTGSSEPEDNDYFVSQYAGGTQNTFHRRPVSALWGYTKGKISSVLGISTSGWKLSGSTANVDTYITAERTDTGVSVAFGVGSGGTNHGLWSHKLDKWMVYGDASNVYLNGDAATATKLKTARTISLTGSVTGSGTFDGSGNLSIATTTNHSHSYLPLSGGTLTGNVTFAEVTSTTYPAKSCGIYWNGSTDGASIYYRVDGNDAGRLVLNLTDDDNTYITFAKSGRDFATIDTSGNYSGNAATATKLSTSAGSATQPVYFSGGKPVACTYTLGKSVPSNAVFTDTVYTHPTSSGNKHIPSGGSSGQILRWSANGTAVWGNDNNTTYSNFVKSGSGAKAGLVPAPSTTAGTTKYLREDGTWAVPPNTTYTSLKNPYTLTIQGNGTTLTNGTYDGSAAKTVNITPSSIGAAPSSHTHNYLPLSGGTMTGNILSSGSNLGNFSYPFNNAHIKYSLNLTDSTACIYSTVAGNVLNTYNSSSIPYGTLPEYVTDKAIVFGNTSASSIYRGDYIEINSYSGWISANTSISIYSDEKVKNFTEDIETDEDKLIKIFDEIILRSYTYKSSKNNSLSIGLSGQELEQLCLDNDIDPEKYNFLNIRYNYRLDNGDGEENTKFYLKFITISYEELYALALLKIKRMEKEHISRLNQSETEIAELKTEMSEVNDKLNEIMTLLNSN